MKTPLAVWLFVLLVAPSLRAQPKPEVLAAEGLIDRGLSLREQNQDAAALELFQRAYALSKTPRALAQVGFAEQALGHWLDAEVHVEGALGAKGDPWIEKNRAAIEVALAKIKQRLGTLEVVGGPTGAEVIVNGQRAGTLPLEHPVRVVAGTSTLEVRAPGYVPLSRPVIVSELSRETVELLPQPQLNVSRQEATPQSLASVAERAAESPPATPSEGPSRNPLRTLGWVAVGAAALFVAGGFVAYGMRESEVAAWNDNSQCLYAPIANEMKSREQNCSNHRQHYETAQSLEIAGFAVGGALAVTSLVLLALPQKSEKMKLAAVNCGSGPGALGIACGVRF